MEFSTQIPLHPKRRRVMPRKWNQEPEERTINSLEYRSTRYGQGMTAPVSLMQRNMRKQQEFRRMD
jgi:hypothetical protein